MSAAAAQAPVTFPGPTTVGQPSAALTVSVTISGNGLAVAPLVVSQGNLAADFNATLGGTCLPGIAYSAGQSCTVSVVFTPKYPGLRTGAVVLRAADGSILGSTLLAGTGKGSLGVLQPGQMDTVAGNDTWLFRNDGVAATLAPIFLPQGVVVDAVGNIYLSDSTNNRVRRVDVLTGLISTVAGNGVPGFSGDGALASSASISQPIGIAVDGAGNLFFVDSANQVVRRVDAVSGVITTFAGTGGKCGYAGDTGPANAAQLCSPSGIVFDAQQNLYIADSGNSVVRVVDAVTGKIRTIAGTGTAGYNGDAILATAARLSAPSSIAIGLDGSIFIADRDNNRIRRVDGAGIITTVVGTGVQGIGGDTASAMSAKLNSPAAITLDPAGNMYIADSGNNRVRKIAASTGIITTITGTGDEAFSGDAGPANLASVYGPIALSFAGNGDLLVADMFHNRIRRISGTKIALQYATIRVGKISPPQAESLENDGNADLTLLPPVFLNAALDPATTTCGTAPLASDANCVLGVEFAPTVVGDLILGSVTQLSNAGNSPNIVNVSGKVLTVEPTTVDLTSSNNPSLVGSAVAFTATVRSADTSRGGAVTFLDGTTVLCSNIVLNAAGTAACSNSALTLGQHSITASYSGDENNASSVSAPLIQVVQQPTTLVLAVTPNPTVVTTSVSLTINASAAAGTPTGGVTFFDGSNSIGTANLTAGAASLSTTQLTAGSHNLSVRYAGDSTNAAGTSNVVVEVINLGTTVTTIGSSNTNTAYGSPVTLTGTVTATSGPMPTGTLQFLEGTNVVGTGTLNATGVATLTLSTLASGTHNILASYGGDLNDAASNSSSLVEVVQQIATTTTLTSGLNPAAAGALVQLTAKVAVAAGAVANGAITGTVNFNYGAATLGSAPVNASGVATITVSTLPVGADSITASYSGDTNYVASNSAALLETITLASSSLTLGGPATVDVGTTATFTVVLAATGPTPNGTMTLRDGANIISVQPATTKGNYTFSSSTLALGAHTLTALFAGDVNYTPGTSNAITVVVQQGATSTALLSSVNTQVLGQGITFTATVTSTSPTITGTVTLKEGATSLGSAPLNAAGVATFSLSTLTFGPHVLTAVYSGDTNHSTSTSSVLNQKIVQGAPIALTSSVNPATAGNAITFTAKLTGAASLTPSGVVTFLDGAAILGTGTVDASGTATFATSALFVGVHTITASYPGDTNFAAVTSAALLETVQSASTQIALTASSNPSIYGTPLTFSAAITTNGAIATGSVTFTDGGTSIGSTLLDASGVATLTLSTLAPGAHTIVANYGGDSNTAASSSTPLALSVKQLTAVLLASNANPALSLNAIVLSASVTNSGVGVAAGTVTFKDGSAPLGTATLDAQGHATLTVPSLSVGNHPITASYGGDGADFANTSETLVQGVQLRPTSTVLTATSSTTNTQLVTLISVVRWTGPATPTGSVVFKNGSTVLGSSAVDATGVATVTILLPFGTQSIVASYSGDAAYAASDSLVTSITGNPVPQFTMLIDPATMTMQSKQHGTVNITIASVKGFTDTLEFGCLGLPFAATCTFSSTQVKLAADGTQKIQLTIDTGNPLGAGAVASNAHASNSGVLMCFIPGAMLVGFVLFRRKRSLPMLSVIVLMLGMGAMLSATGCAGLQVNGTPPGTYTFKIAGTGAQSGVVETQTMTLTVTQ